MHAHRSFISILAVVVAFIACGCETYRAPGHAADFRALGITHEEAHRLTDVDIADRLERRPLASFPASIAVVRVQGRSYASHTMRGYGSGNFTIVSARDVETDDHFQRIVALSMVRSVQPLNRLVIPERLNSARQLRQAAAEAQCDMLLLYTFETAFGTESKLAPLSVFTIGLFPEREARVTSTASAALIDTRNGYLYGLAEATSRTTQVANAWTSAAAVDDSRRRAERAAFEQLVQSIESMWHGVVRQYGPSDVHAAH
jgi:hypothetical protein